MCSPIQSNGNIIHDNHNLITSKLNEVFLATSGNEVSQAHLVRPFVFVQSTPYRITGSFRFANGAEHPWCYSSEEKSLSELEREINLDLLDAFFHQKLAHGLIKTNNLFKIQYIHYFDPCRMDLLVSTKGFFDDYKVVQIDLEEDKVYDFATGRLNVKSIDDIISERLKSSAGVGPVAEQDQADFLSTFSLQLFLRRVQGTGVKELEHGVPLNPCRVTENTETIQLPFVRLT